jgi:hypothetical protein
MPAPSKSLEERPVEERLREGAKILGQLWRKNVRCESGWRVQSDRGYPDCPCKAPGAFCRAKIQWAILALGAGRVLEEGPFGLLATMTVSEIDLSGVSIIADVSGMAGFKIGRGGNARATDLIELARDPESAVSVLSLLKAFPGSRMEISTGRSCDT